MGKRYILLVGQRRDGYDCYNRSQSGWLRPDSMAKPTATRINCDIDIVLICFCTYVTSSGFIYFFFCYYYFSGGREVVQPWVDVWTGGSRVGLDVFERKVFPGWPLRTCADAKCIPNKMNNTIEIERNGHVTTPWKENKTAFCYTQKWIYKFYWSRISMTQYLKFIKRRCVIISWFSLPFACRSETWRKKKRNVVSIFSRIII